MAPTMFSPIRKVPVMVPSSRLLVVAFQVLTLPVAPLTEPVTTSLNANVPEPPVAGAAIVIVGATVYARPALVI